jgi:hypothetical protein
MSTDDIESIITLTHDETWKSIYDDLRKAYWVLLRAGGDHLRDYKTARDFIKEHKVEHDKFGQLVLKIQDDLHRQLNLGPNSFLEEMLTNPDEDADPESVYHTVLNNFAHELMKICPEEEKDRVIRQAWMVAHMQVEPETNEEGGPEIFKHWAEIWDWNEMDTRSLKSTSGASSDQDDQESRQTQQSQDSKTQAKQLAEERKATLQRHWNERTASLRRTWWAFYTKDRHEHFTFGNFLLTDSPVFKEDYPQAYDALEKEIEDVRRLTSSEAIRDSTDKIFFKVMESIWSELESEFRDVYGEEGQRIFAKQVMGSIGIPERVRDHAWPDYHKFITQPINISQWLNTVGTPNYGSPNAGSPHQESQYDGSNEESSGSH